MPSPIRRRHVIEVSLMETSSNANHPNRPRGMGVIGIKVTIIRVLIHAHAKARGHDTLATQLVTPLQ